MKGNAILVMFLFLFFHKMPQAGLGRSYESQGDDCWEAQTRWYYQIDLQARVEIDDWIYSTPTIIPKSPQDEVMVASYSGHLHFFGLDGATKSTIDIGTVFKTRVPLLGPKLESTPAVAKTGTIVLGGSLGYVYFLGPDRKPLAKFKTKGAIKSSPLITPDGTVIVGSEDGHLYFFSLEGKLNKSVDLGAPIRSSPTLISRDTVAVGSDAGHLYFFDLKGNLKMTSERTGTLVGRAIRSSPTVAKDGTIVVGADDGRLYFFDPLDGTIKMRSDKMGEAIWSSPAVAKDGTIVVGSDDGRTYFYNQEQRTFKAAESIGSPVRSSPRIIGGLGDQKLAVVNGGKGDVYFYDFNGVFKAEFKGKEAKVPGGMFSGEKDSLSPSVVIAKDRTIIVPSKKGNFLYFLKLTILPGPQAMVLVDCPLEKKI